MPTILFGERTDKTKDNKYGWNTLYDGRKENPEVREDTLLGKRSIICLPGDGSNSERDANAHCGAVQRMLTVAGVSKENMPHIYGIAYFESHTTDHRQKIIVNSGQNTLDTRPIKFSFQYYHPLFNKYLLPLIVHTNGQARSVEEIKKNLQNITFVSHCHGGFVAHQIEKMLADKIAEFYPDQQKQLMKNIRMIHFSSRRPIGHSSGAQHLDIISRNDSNYADSDMLERDNIHAQINRSKSGNNSALLSFSPEEKALVFKRLTTDKWGSRDHSEILDIFSREKENPIPENETGIHFIQSVLKKFVEHPTDQRDMESIFKEIDPIFTSESIACGQTLLAEEKENEKIHRGILSILASPFVRFGGILKGKGVVEQGDLRDIFLQRDDDGRFLLETYQKQYLETGDDRSIKKYIKFVDRCNIPSEDREVLTLAAVKNRHWDLANMLNTCQHNPKWALEVVQSISPDDLHKALPLLNGVLSNNPECYLPLMQRIKGIKAVLKKQAVENMVKNVEWGLILNEVPQSEKNNIVLAAIKNRHWKVANRFTYFENNPEWAKKVFDTIQPADLPEIPDLVIGILSKNKRYLAPVIQKIQKIEDPVGKKTVEKAFKDYGDSDIFEDTGMDYDKLKGLKKCYFKDGRMDDWKIVKAFFADVREDKAEKIKKIVHDRDQKAKGHHIKDILTFFMKNPKANIEDFLQAQKRANVQSPASPKTSGRD